jgi:hypothetical protein
MPKMLTSKNGRWTSVLMCLLVVVGLVAVQSAAGEDTNPHALKGIVKSVDMASHTLVVTRHDGTELTFTLTNATVMQGAKGASGGVTSGSRVVVKYTENGGIKTASEVKGLPLAQPEH